MVTMKSLIVLEIDEYIEVSYIQYK